MTKFARIAPTRNFILVLLLLILALAPRASFALEVDVSGGRINPLPIAITPFLAGGGAEEAATTLGEVISNNLGRSGYSPRCHRIPSLSRLPISRSNRALLTGNRFKPKPWLPARFMWMAENPR